ncbi:MAG: hypothetical protein AAFR03_12420 [Pseudomonadota bacterium]
MTKTDGDDAPSTDNDRNLRNGLSNALNGDGGRAGVDRPTSIAEDMAYLRRIADDGRQTVTMYGGYMALWGTLIAAAYLHHFIVISVAVPDYARLGFGYLAMLLVGWAGTAVLVRSSRRHPGPRPLLARVFQTVFACAGLVVTVASLNLLIERTVPPETIVILAAQLMGLCFLVTGILARMPWKTAIGGAWLVASLALPHLTTEASFYLMAAAVWLLLLAAPGFVLLWLRHMGHGDHQSRSPTGDNTDLSAQKGVSL